MDPMRAAELRLTLSTTDEDRAQLRRELCLARGAHPDDIDPDTGHDLSRRAYDQVRAEWRNLARDGQWTSYRAAAYRKARARWEQRRPEWTAGDPWIADLVPDLTH